MADPMSRPGIIKSVTLKATGQRIDVITPKPISPAGELLKSDISWASELGDRAKAYALVVVDDNGGCLGVYCTSATNNFKPSILPEIVKKHIEYLMYEHDGDWADD